MAVAINNKTQLRIKKSVFCSYLSHILASTPLNLFPIEVLKNHPPIINAVMRGGLNLETKLNPIGLKNNSPIVITP